MILFREFNEEEKIDRIWYQSSMVVYSECYDKPDSALKDITVVFKNGSSYLYKDIKICNFHNIIFRYYLNLNKLYQDLLYNLLYKK